MSYKVGKEVDFRTLKTNLFLLHRGGMKGAETAYMNTATFTKYNEQDYSTIIEPSFIFHHQDEEYKDFLQALVNFAYDEERILPTNFKAESNSQKAHLEDMRQLAFKGLDIPYEKLPTQ